MYERFDGFIEAGPGPALYLAGPQQWPAPERQALRLARGRVADVGCGAGRVALALQQRGVDVVGIDTSALALRAARRRGVRRVEQATAVRVGLRLSDFDTVVLYGNNFGIFGPPAQVRAGFAAWARHARPGTRILAESTDPAGGAPAFDTAYGRANRVAGAMVGQLRLRIRYHDLASPWFWWLFVSPAQMRSLLAGTGWRMVRVFKGGRTEPYVAVLERGPH